MCCSNNDLYVYAACAVCVSIFSTGLFQSSMLFLKLPVLMRSWLLLLVDNKSKKVCERDYILISNPDEGWGGGSGLETRMYLIACF